MEQIDLFMGVHIPLYNRIGKVVAETIVDAADAPPLLEYRWFFSKAGKGHAYCKGYAYRQLGNGNVVRMHREIMRLPRREDGRQVDHKNRNGLDNRRDNLRILTHAQNRQNISSHRGSTSVYRGVYWHNRDHRWRAQVRVNGVKYEVGSFLNEEEANLAVIAARLQLMPFSIETNHLL